MNRIKVQLFATLRQLVGAKVIEVEIPDGMSVRELKAMLVRDYPNLKDAMGTVLVAVNREYAFDDAILPAGCEIALFPPVSGG